MLDMTILEGCVRGMSQHESALNSRSRRKLFGKLMMGLSIPGRYFFSRSRLRRNLPRFRSRGAKLLTGIVGKGLLSISQECELQKDLEFCIFSLGFDLDKRGSRSILFGSCGKANTMQPNCVWSLYEGRRRWRRMSLVRVKGNKCQVVPRRGNYRDRQTYLPSFKVLAGYGPDFEKT